MFDKTQIKCFYQCYFNHDINSKQIITYQLQTKHPHKFLFKFHINSNKSIYP
jgi:hypothetical protein